MPYTSHETDIKLPDDLNGHRLQGKTVHLSVVRNINEYAENELKEYTGLVAELVARGMTIEAYTAKFSKRDVDGYLFEFAGRKFFVPEDHTFIPYQSSIPETTPEVPLWFLDHVLVNACVSLNVDYKSKDSPHRWLFRLLVSQADSLKRFERDISPVYAGSTDSGSPSKLPSRLIRTESARSVGSTGSTSSISSTLSTAFHSVVDNLMGVMATSRGRTGVIFEKLKDKEFHTKFPPTTLSRPTSSRLDLLGAGKGMLKAMSRRKDLTHTESSSGLFAPPSSANLKVSDNPMFRGSGVPEPEPMDDKKKPGPGHHSG